MKARLPRFFRLRSFWLGLPTFIFLLWAWRDSMIHAAAVHQVQGPPVIMDWPPFAPAEDLPSPELEAEPSPAARFDLEELSPYREAGAAINPPLLDQGIIPDPQEEWSLGAGGIHRIIHKEFKARPEQIWSYRSLGNHSGALWASWWRSSRQMPEHEYRPTIPGTQPAWFPAPVFGTVDQFENRTLRLPYWLLGGGYLGVWVLVMRWRLRRRDRVPALSGC